MLKPKINTLLPIALAIILPGLSLYSNVGGPLLPEKLGVTSSWITASILLFGLWYMLWFLWENNSKYKNGLFAFVLVAFLGIVFGLLHLLGIKDFFDFRGPFTIRMVLMFVLILSIQYALKAQQNIARLSLEKEQLQSENYKTQLKALRAQIDPHFLFNSLNTLRSMVRQHHANSEKFVMSLADFYRQTLKHNENTPLPLSDELEVLKSYVFLMKSRNEGSVSVTYAIEEGSDQMHLPALALQVVVENCFKHNSMTAKSPLNIRISNTEDGYIEVCNNLQPKLGNDDPSGLGLEMLRKRYELIKIPQGVVVTETPDTFCVKLKLI